MKTGTKSLLFGTHQFLWHPYTVLRGWLHVHKCWPRWWEFVTICLHDVGYWGCPTMDGKEGKRHPEAGAQLAFRVVRTLREFYLQVRHPLIASTDWGEEWVIIDATGCGNAAYRLSLLHSFSYARLQGLSESRLYLADKASILFDPCWFYLLRGKLSGELWEYIYNSPGGPNQTAREWFKWYRGVVFSKVYIHTHTGTLK